MEFVGGCDGFIGNQTASSQHNYMYGGSRRQKKHHMLTFSSDPPDQDYPIYLPQHTTISKEYHNPLLKDLIDVST